MWFIMRQTRRSSSLFGGKTWFFFSSEAGWKQPYTTQLPYLITENCTVTNQPTSVAAHHDCCSGKSPPVCCPGHSTPWPGSGSPAHTPWCLLGPSFPWCSLFCLPRIGCNLTSYPPAGHCTCHMGSTVFRSAGTFACSCTCLSSCFSLRKRGRGTEMRGHARSDSRVSWWFSVTARCVKAAKHVWYMQQNLMKNCAYKVVPSRMHFYWNIVNHTWLCMTLF